VETTVFLVRHGVTPWHKARRVLGHRDIDLDEEGLAQADAVADALADLPVTEVISSPLARAVQTADRLASRYQTHVTRDPRVTDFRVGRWEGMSYDEVAASREYQEFVKNPMATGIPDGEKLIDVRDRAVAAVEQTLEDTPAGDAVVVVTHAGIVRILLTHYIGAELAHYHRLRVSPGSISVLSFPDVHALPRVLITNWTPCLRGAMGWSPTT